MLIEGINFAVLTVVLTLIVRVYSSWILRSIDNYDGDSTSD